MRKLLLMVCALFGFMACTQNSIEEQSAIRTDTPETIRAGFEDDETRIQLNEAQKTVWTKDDLVSVFYKSDANQKWEYRGETGERVAELYRVDAGTASSKMNYVVLAYPYSTDYVLSTASGNIEATLPATQHYAEGSYGVGNNLMVSQSEFTQFSLKSVCGWLKLQLTGNGEVVKGIKFRGNNGEQVAGLIHVDTKSAEATLYSEEVAPDDNGNANGSLVIDGAMATEVMLYCYEGVTLSSEATAFYIALPPQTFEEGFTVDVICADGTMMAKSSDKKLSIERNHIQPMAAFEFAATGTTDIPTEPENTVNPNLPSNENNKIYYTTTDGRKMFPTNYGVTTFGAILISNIYKDGVGVMTFDDDVTTIGYEAFRGCTNLTSVNIPDSVTTIGDAAFSYCDGLTSVTIGDSVTTIGDGAFVYCVSLKEFKGKYATKDGRSLIVDNTIIAYANASGTTYTIPDSVTTIGDAAFRNCTSLTSVNIPDSVTTIGSYVFYECYSLKKVYCYASIPPSLGDGAFSSNTSGRRIYVYEECVELYKSAWSSYKDRIYTNGDNCPDTTTIEYTTTDGNTITSSKLPIISNSYDNGVGTMVISGIITVIPYSAFRECSSLTSVTIPDSVTTIRNYAFAYCSSLTSVTIPDSVITIGNDAFKYCSSLTSVNIPDSVTTIESFAFYECSSLTSVTIPDSVTTIGYYAFYNCTSLTSVTIPDSVITIGGYAFYGCSSLTSVTIPDSVITIGGYAFYGCSSLTSVNIPDSVTTIESCAFYECSSLTSVTIGDSVTTIGDYAFYYCSSLTSVTIPDSVTTIGDYAFSGCDSLTSITIPDSVTTIGKYAFYNCSSLTSVYCKAITPPVGGFLMFYSNASGLKIYVHMESVEAYKSASYWSDYASDIVGYNF